VASLLEYSNLASVAELPEWSGGSEGHWPPGPLMLVTVTRGLSFCIQPYDRKPATLRRMRKAIDVRSRPEPPPLPELLSLHGVDPAGLARTLLARRTDNHYRASSAADGEWWPLVESPGVPAWQRVAAAIALGRGVAPERRAQALAALALPRIGSLVQSGFDCPDAESARRLLASAGLGR
jgi:hypothetical protein